MRFNLLLIFGSFSIISCHSSKYFSQSEISLCENNLVKLDTQTMSYKQTTKQLGTYTPKMLVFNIDTINNFYIVKGKVEFPPSLIFENSNGFVKKRKLNTVRNYRIIYVQKLGKEYYPLDTIRINNSDFKFSIPKDSERYFVLDVDVAPNKPIYDFKTILDCVRQLE